MEIPKAYDPKLVEDAIYDRWMASGFFNPDKLPGKRPQAFTISMPPPNATGVLHIGHAEFVTIQDLVTRFQRMRGKKTLWVPGTDHAAIATQAKVEKVLYEKEKKTRHDLGREEFLARVNAFVAESQTTIRKQIRKMGASCDWSRERFTLDDGLSHAVRTAFVKMYQDGLIYRGERIVNWCTSCGSTLSDDEVEHKTQSSKLYFIKYGDSIVVATTRPETKVGDTAVAVHPDDKRYKKLIGTNFDVRLGKLSIHVKVIADQGIDPKFGSGALGVTPAHSQIDFDMASRNNLPLKQVIGPDGKMTELAGAYVGLPVEETRKVFVKDLEEQGALEKIEDIKNNISICYRCGTAVEPMPSEQWFINVNKKSKRLGGKTIREKALEVVKQGEIEIIPQRFQKTYFHWIENLRDWCISRQIWYGHRIPVWYRSGTEQMATSKSNLELFVGTEAPKEIGWIQDPDTLDTWFSSGLWTFSTLGWPDSAKASSGGPEKTGDLKTFHPTSLMETGYDILFFWVARMIIMSSFHMQQVPFKQVYLHGLIRDDQGRKMSKSLDNIIDPLDMIEKFGTDAVRLSLMIGITPGNDMNLSEAKIGGYRNFVNKLWNISRFVLSTVEKPRLIEKRPQPRSLADEWILSELDSLIEGTTTNLEKYQFSVAGEQVYEFTWSKFADWYVEVAKIEKDKDEILLYVLQQLLRLWHPFTPFVTEHLWPMVTGQTDDLLIVESWPAGKAGKSSAAEFTFIKNVITAIRTLRQESGIALAEKLRAEFVADKKRQGLLEDQQAVILSLARLQGLRCIKDRPSQSLSVVVEGVEIYLPVSGMIDIEKEVARLRQELERIQQYIQAQTGKLGNKEFVKNAPKEIVEIEQQKLADSQDKAGKIEQQLTSLQ